MNKEEGIYHLIKWVNHKNVEYGFLLLKEENLHPKQVPLLVNLWKQEGCTQKELADSMEIKPPTLNVMIGRMEKNGLIERRKDEKDSRKSRIYFTDKGRNICEEYKDRFGEIQKQVQDYFTEEEQEEMKRLLNKFCDCLDEQINLLKQGKERSDA